MSCFLDRNSKILEVAGYSRLQKKTLMLSHNEIIDNYELQAQKSEPHFEPRTRTEAESDTLPRGFLIWSLDEGCGICFKRPDGAYYLLTGHQGDFRYVI